MRCEHCGRNEATFHYQSTVNGHTEETHLCSACAAELGYTARSGAEDWFDGEPMSGFDSVFSLLPSMFGGFGLFDGPRLTPAARRTLQLAPTAEPEVYETESLLDETEGKELCRERERNALNLQLHNAVEAEDYEQAARLRDELKKLEAN